MGQGTTSAPGIPIAAGNSTRAAIASIKGRSTGNTVLASLGARVPFWMAARVTLASFLVSHITPFGSATGTLLNVSTLEAQGIAAATTGEAIGLTSLMSTVALIALFGVGFAATAGRHLSSGYLTIAGVALGLVVLVLALALV